jgi:hypothetical protein
MHIEFKNLCNASKHMNMHISNANKQGSWACSPYMCASLIQEFWSFLIHLNVAPSLSISMYKPTSYISYLCTNLSPFVINFHKRYVIPIKSLDTNWKGVHLIVTKDCIWGRWLRLEFCIFDGHHHMCWNDITWIALEIPHGIFDLDTNRWGTSPYVIAWVIHLSILLVRELSLLGDHLKLRIACGIIFLYDWYHMYKCDITWKILSDTKRKSSTN